MAWNYLTINFRDFTSGKSNKLFIVGLSGSGKTTLSDSLSNMYNADIYETDMCISSVKSVSENWDKYIDCIKTLTLKKYKSKSIINGVGIVALYNHSNKKIKDEILKTPMIITGTSILKSTFRATLRDNRNLKEIYLTILKNSKWQKTINEIIEEAKKRKLQITTL